MTFGMTLGEHLTMATSGSEFYIETDYKNKTNMKVAASNINIKIYQLFYKQQIPGVCVITAKRKISRDVIQTCSPCRPCISR